MLKLLSLANFKQRKVYYLDHFMEGENTLYRLSNLSREFEQKRIKFRDSVFGADFCEKEGLSSEF